MSNEVKIRFTGDQRDLKKTAGDVKAEIAGIGKTAKDQQRAMDGLRNSIKGFAASAISIGAVVSAVRGLAEITDDYGDIADAASKSGFSPEFLQKVSNAAETCGGNVEMLTNAAARLSKEIVFADEAALSTQALNALGFEVETLREMSPDDLFEKVGKAIASIPDPTQRTAAAMAIFGKAGKDLVPTLLEMNKGLSETAILTKQQVADLDAAGDAWTRWKIKGKAAIASVLADIVNGDLLGRLANIRPGMIAGSGGAAAADAMAGGKPSGSRRDVSSYPVGHRGGDKPDFQAMLARQEEKDAADAKAKSDREEIAKLDEQTADIVRKSDLVGLSSEDRLIQLESELRSLEAQLAGTTDPKRQAELRKEIAEKNAEIAAEHRAADRPSGRGSGGAAATDPSSFGSDLAAGQLREEKIAEAYRADKSTYDPTTGERLPEALGRQRLLDRQAARARGSENNRQARGFGGATQGRGTGSASREADIRFGRGPKPGDTDFIGPTATKDQLKSMQSAAAASSPGAEKAERAQTDNQLLQKIHDVLNERLPEDSIR